MIKKLTSIVALSAALALAPGTNALSFDITDPNIVGTIVTVVAPGNPDNETIYVNHLIGMSLSSSESKTNTELGTQGGPGNGSRTFTRSANDFGTLDSVTYLNNKVDSNSATIDVTGYTYLFIAEANSGYLWHVGNLSGLQQVPKHSHSILFNPRSVPTPDGGATAALLGLGLLGLAGMARKRQ